RPTRAKRTTYNVVCLVVAGEGRSRIGEETFEWSQHDVFTIPHWTFARHEARGGDADLFMVTDKSAFERLDLVREEVEGPSSDEHIVSRAQRSVQRCAADPGPFETVAIPDQRCTATQSFALHRIRDTHEWTPRNVSATIRVSARRCGASKISVFSPGKDVS